MNKEKDYINIINEIFNFKDDKNVIIGIGDDAALVKGENHQVICSDSIVEGVHFNLDYFSLEDVGWKSIVVNQSDIASMGGEPQFFTTSWGITDKFNPNDIEMLANGMKMACDNFGGIIIGGDIVKSETFFISVSSVGSIKSLQNTMSRASALPGEKIGVTGALGNSVAGLKLLESGQVNKVLSRSHLRPEPQIQKGVSLATNGVRCCMDISDGLQNDLVNLCESSKVSVEINVQDIPISDELKGQFADSFFDIAISGGEDYELLFTFKDLPKKIMDSISVIGEVKESHLKQINYNFKNALYTPKINPWRHFE